MKVCVVALKRCHTTLVALGGVSSERSVGTMGDVSPVKGHCNTMGAV